MSNGCCVRRLIAAGACVLWAASLAVAQDSVEQFYKGKSIQLIVGSSVGGGYDTYARLLARHVSSVIPGNPSIVPQNMSGAGSNRAAGYIYSVAPKDGTVIGAIFPGAVVQPLLGEQQVQHDPSKFIYVGNANSDVYVCFVRTDAPVKSFKDALTHELIVGASNEGGTTRDLPIMLNNLIGTKFRIVTGYAGSREITLALERGEVQGVCGIGWTGIEAMHPHWFARDIIRPLVQLSVKGHTDLNKRGIPTTLEFAGTEDERQVMELVYSQGVFGRPFVLPPGVPADRVAALRRAFIDTMRGNRVQTEAERMKLDVEPIAGDELQAIVTRVYATPAYVVERARQALTAKPQR